MDGSLPNGLSDSAIRRCVQTVVKRGCQEQGDQTQTINAAGNNAPSVSSAGGNAEHPPKAGDTQYNAHPVTGGVDAFLGYRILSLKIVNGDLSGRVVWIDVWQTTLLQSIETA